MLQYCFLFIAQQGGIANMKIAHHHGFHLVHILSAFPAAAGRTEAYFPGNVYLHLTKVGGKCENGEMGKCVNKIHLSGGSRIFTFPHFHIFTLLPMRSVIQRVSRAAITIDGKLKSSIGPGMLVLIGIEEEDGPEDIEWLSKKMVHLRIFDDEAGVMNRSLIETGGELMLVSQFTLFASTKKGNRPSYIRASKPAAAIPVYEAMIVQLEKDLGKKIQTGVFGADMKVDLLNDGPVTILMDSKSRE
jgi:D-tyrosyl-tRNA(Tyr) deacylase